MRGMKTIGVLLLAAFILTACGGTDTSTTDMASGSSGELVVDQITANLTLPTASGAVYMRITNGTTKDDALVGAIVPGCGLVELHEMIMDGDVMRMNPVEGGQIPIPAGQTVMLERGGLHVMCLDKTGTYEVGQMVPVTLQFTNAGTLEVMAEVMEPGEINMNMGESGDNGDMDMGEGD